MHTTPGERKLFGDYLSKLFTLRRHSEVNLQYLHAAMFEAAVYGMSLLKISSIVSMSSREKSS